MNVMKLPRVAIMGPETLSRTQTQIIVAHVDRVCANASAIITGARRGAEAFIAQYVAARHPSIFNVIVVPAERERVEQESLAIHDAMFVYMPAQTNYEDQAKKIIELADRVDLFWSHGIAVARKRLVESAGKLGEVIHFDR